MSVPSLVNQCNAMFWVHRNMNHDIKGQFHKGIKENGRECSGSVVECLTRDRGAAGSSLTGITALCP